MKNFHRKKNTQLVWACILPWLFIVLCGSCNSCGARPGENGMEQRPAKWATPMSATGLPNLHRMTDSLYRGAQPEAAGFVELERMGIRTVVNLRHYGNDKDEFEKSRITSGSMTLVSIPMDAGNVSRENIIAFLRVATDDNALPLFFHCKHGADRTGTMAAAYRMVVQGWTTDEAIAEMKNGGYNYHAMWKNLPELLQKLDVAKIQEILSLPTE